MKYKLIEDNWVQQTTRIKNDYFIFFAYLDFLSVRDNLDRHLQFDSIIKYSLDYINKEGCCFYCEDYTKKRKPKGIFLSQDTNKLFNGVLEEYNNDFKQKYDRDIYKGEFLEILLYIYARNNLEDHLKILRVNWGVKKF